MMTTSVKIPSLETDKHPLQNEGLRPPVTQCPDEPRSPGWFRHLKFFTAGLLLAIIAVRYVVPTFGGFKLGVPETPLDTKAVCPKTSAIVPHTHADILKKLEAEYANESFHDQAFAWLGGAVKIPTQMYDDMKQPGEDPRWDVFKKLHSYIDSHFDFVNLKKTNINTYGLVYHWQGSNTDLKPILFTAHQDVIPVAPDTINDWINPPFSGIWDGQWLWGRGSCDDKPGLIGSLAAVQKLGKAGFKPERTIVLAFGFDEEHGGIIGATKIRDHLLSTYGEDGFAILIDEGGFLEGRTDGVIATPAVAEKGHFDLRMVVSSAGGHSSVPPEHTSIGILAALIAELEANPHEPHLYRDEPYFTALQCQAILNSELDDDLRGLIKKSRSSDKALFDLEKKLFATDVLADALSKNTQAVDLIGGGVKSNALPENAYAVVNHRIAQHSSVSAVKAHIVDTLTPIAKKFNLTLDAFGDELHGMSNVVSSGHLKLTDAWGTALEPAPVTPWIENSAFDFLAGTIQTVVKTSKRWNNPDIPVAVAPGILSGNTDTRYYWKLTKNIFRYRHVSRFDKYNGAHTVNEAIFAEAFIDLIRFFTITILNADETDLLG
ncbi:hypothetical protein QCA50_008916 [Cerrena zonata]|uniref:Peptidase M20 dimerisation domain-containing protein n=1 Tax=Cerrena zonata TaxID=2478898 RepID=A0AAW0GFB5_9APHY